MRAAVDISDHGGELFFDIVAAFMHLQRRQISEKSRAGLAAATACGPTVVTPERFAHARQVRAEGRAYDDIAALLGVEAPIVRCALRAELLA